MIGRILSFGLLGALYAGVLVMSVVGEALGFLVFLVLAALMEAWIASREALTIPSFIDVQLGLYFRILSLDLMAALLAMRMLQAGAETSAIVLCLLVLVLLRGVHSLLRRRRVEAGNRPIGWANLPETGAEPLPVRVGLPGAALRFLPVSAIIPLGLVLTQLAGTRPAALIGAGVAVVVAAILVVLELAKARAITRLSGDEVRERVRGAVEEVAPEVVLYFGGPQASTHVMEVWLPILSALTRPTLVIVRDRWHLEAAARSGIPALHLPKNTDVEYFSVSSLKLALYPTNIAQNNHLIRVPGIFDVFVGHGDSDKGGSATPITRIFDEVWVAGPAARDRYLRAQVGVRDDQVREIGRPQLAEIRRAAAPVPGAPGHTDLFTVLYAPTWEGFYSSWSYSSVATMGPALIAGLLALPGVRVLYKPHPATGSRDPVYRSADARIRALLREAGSPHAVVEQITGLYASFNEADLLVSDISSVVTDFLYSRKPYLVCNPSGQDPAEFQREYPSSGGAAILAPDLDGLAEAVADARGADRRSARREQVARYLLGDSEQDPVQRFADAVEDALELQKGRTRVL